VVRRGPLGEPPPQAPLPGGRSHPDTRFRFCGSSGSLEWFPGSLTALENVYGTVNLQGKK
jgi:hypothetical protein